MPRAPKQVDKTDPEYLEKRKRNNEAIKKSREKAKAKAEETQRTIQILRGEAFRKYIKCMSNVDYHSNSIQ